MVVKGKEVGGEMDWELGVSRCKLVFIRWNVSHKKEKNNAMCSNIDGPRDYHTK